MNKFGPKGQKPPQIKPGKIPSLNNALQIYEQERKKRGNQEVLFLPGGFLNKMNGKRWKNASNVPVFFATH